MPTTPSTRSRTRLGAAAGVLGVAAALTAVTGAGPAPSIFQLTGATEDVRGSCDELEHAADAACAGTLTARQAEDDSSSTSTTSDDTTPTTAGSTAAGAGEVRTVSAGEAGSIMVAVDGTTLQLLTAVPSSGWQVEVEHASGHEVEVTFRSGTVRIDVNVELEDGQVRERVRTRDDATGAETRVENGVIVRDEGPDDDSSGPGSDDSDDDSSVSGSDASSDDSSGSGSDDLDDDSSGHGGDDVNDDTSGHGTDDGPGHD